MLFAGVVIYGTWAWLGEAEVPTIRISNAEVTALEDGLTKRLGRPPAREELEAALSDRIDEELLFREARRHGLEQGDPIVRRRLVQKMTYVLQRLDAPPSISEADIRAWREAHPEQYRRPAQRDLTHVFVGEAEAVAGLREALAAGADPLELGRPFPHARTLTGKDQRGLERMFGAPFAAATFALSGDGWHAVESSYGHHLVRIDRRRAEGLLPIDAVRGRVREAIAAERARASFEEGLRARRAGYRIEVER